MNAAQFWWSVNEILTAGRVVDGRARLLAKAAAQFPGDPTFNAMNGNGSFNGSDQLTTEEVPWTVPPRPTCFVGRGILIDELHRKLLDGGVVALVGMGGVGKTALALEYVYRRVAAYDLVWWIPAENPSLISQHLLGLAGVLGLPAATDVLGVLRELRRRRSWLLVFDNAESVDDIEPYRPADREGMVLVTSRRIGWSGLGQTVRVPALERQESAALLRARIPELERDIAHQIADLLGDLALALEQAAAYMDATDLPPREYVELLETCLEEMARRGRVVDRPGVTVANLWQMSTSRLSETSPAALELLELLSLCAGEPVPLDLFRPKRNSPGRSLLTVSGQHGLRWAETVGALSGLSLARREGSSIVMHRLVQATTRQDIPPERIAAHLDTLVAFCVSYLPTGIAKNPEGWPKWRAMLPHVISILEHAWNNGMDGGRDYHLLCDRTAVYLQEHGQAAVALPLFERAAKIAETIYEPASPAIASSLAHLASAQRDLGRPTSALPLFERTLAITEAEYGWYHPAVARSLKDLAGVLRDLGRPAEALLLMDRALSIDEAAYSSGHPVIAADLGLSVAALCQVGRLADARAAAERALSISRTHYGDDHPVVAGYLGGLALVSREMGNPKAALALLRRALAVERVHYGKSHPVVATRLDALARVLCDLGQTGRARPLVERSLAIAERAYGPDHPVVVTYLDDLAHIVQDLGEAAAARPLLERALAIAERKFGATHPIVGTQLNNLGLLWQDLGDAEIARSLCERALAIATASFGNSHPAVATCLSNLALIMLELGETATAKSLGAQALGIARQSRVSNHPILLAIERNLEPLNV